MRQVGDQPVRCEVSNPTRSWEAYLTYQNGPGFQVLPASLSPYLLQSDWHTPTSTLILQPRGWGCHSPRGSSQYNADILVTCSFLYLDLLSAIFGSTPPLSIWFRVMTTLDSPRCPCFWLCFPYIYNKLSPPPYLGTFESFSFLFISFFFFIHEL